MFSWRRALEQEWATLHFGGVKTETDEKQHLFQVQVYLSGVDPKAVRVELYADGINGGSPERHEMQCVALPAGAPGDCLFRATVPATRPATDYTARVIPKKDGVAVPLEVAKILWHR